MRSRAGACSVAHCNARFSSLTDVMLDSVTLHYRRMLQISRIFLIGVLLGVAADQSEVSFVENQPIASQETGQRRQDTPAVVLQLKYNEGELDRIYLAQFRKGDEPWAPSVPAKASLCADLCHSGLGGEACGGRCSDLTPIGLQSALENSTDSAEHPMYGSPRVSVCPTLCSYRLGEPLCKCAESAVTSTFADWSSICTAFCVADRYVLGGCPPCEVTASPAAFSRVLQTNEGWSAWCNSQCRQGQGGAACNCDRAPFV